MRRVAFSLAGVLLTLLFVEGVAFVAIRFLQSKHLAYRTPVAVEGGMVDSFAQYRELRDPELGWPFPSRYGSASLASDGSRPDPAYPRVEEHPPCLAAFGDSYTAAAEVDDAHAWSAVLSQRLGCRVANHGQGGYGSDQAYLRYRRQQGSLPRVVVLGHLTENVIRNVMRCRDLYSHQRHYGFKPRFVLDAAGGLELLPMPALASEHEYERLVGLATPPLELPHEYFLPDGPVNPVVDRPPFTLALLRNRRHFALRARLRGEPAYASFYDPAHPAGGLAITSAILERFAREARESGREPIVIVFVGVDELAYHARTGRFAYQPLRDRLAAAGVDAIDMGPILLAHVGEGDPSPLYTGGHYSELGNRLVADAIEARLAERGLLPRAR